jgi:hypothetical protein
MCCTFGDETDIRWWKKHNLELKVIIGKDGKIEGLPLKQYKEKIIEQLKNTQPNHSPLEGESASVSVPVGGQPLPESLRSSTLPQGEGDFFKFFVCEFLNLLKIFLNILL